MSSRFQAWVLVFAPTGRGERTGTAPNILDFQLSGREVMNHIARSAVTVVALLASSDCTRPIATAQIALPELLGSTASAEAPTRAGVRSEERGVPNPPDGDEVIRPGKVNLADDADPKGVRDLAAFWREVLSVQREVMLASFSYLTVRVSTLVRLAEIRSSAAESLLRTPGPVGEDVESRKSFIARLESAKGELPAVYLPPRELARSSLAPVEAISKDLIPIEAWLLIHEDWRGRPGKRQSEIATLELTITHYDRLLAFGKTERDHYLTLFRSLIRVEMHDELGKLERQPLETLGSCDTAAEGIRGVASPSARDALIVLEDCRFLLAKTLRWEVQLAEARKKVAGLEAAR
jgi:hypothetical protein